jgi:tetratricopeptide (TPR) repeat protein
MGAMARVEEILPDGTRRVRFFQPDQFKQYMAANVARQAPDDPQLRVMLKQFHRPADAEVALLIIDHILSGNPPDEVALLIQRADTLRMLKRIPEAERVLRPFLLDEEENHPEAHYVQAWCHFDSGNNGEGWDCIRDTLLLDPNHQRAIQAKFRIGRDNKDPQTIEKLSEWAAQHESWRGHWVASIQASTNKDAETALRCAEAAYKLAPQERDALFLYANCLNNMDEGEYTAALVHPRLPEAKGDYVLKYIFAGAMKKLKLTELAIRVLRESLEEESDMPTDWRHNTQHFLDTLTGLVATSEIDLEFHPNTDTLRREVWGGGDEGPQVALLRAGVSLPQERAVRMTPRPGYTGSTGSMAMYHHGRHAELEPAHLGWFQVHEIDFSVEEPPMLTVTVTTRRKLEATARQGERRLPVTWTLYRVPSMENDPSNRPPE